IDARLADLATVRPEVTWMRNDVYARLCHSDYSKGTALLEIQRLLGLTPEVVFTVGDHLNDLSMLAPEVARYFAVPKNAVTPVIERVEKLEGRVSEYSFGLAVANELARLRCG
ncbi:MAG: HAD hydrolase family protein, partial [Verrucomicrobiae bacterium]|nr:HAD hydrolase family protein [Verrucomicrobiae bacterium]